MKMTKKLAAGLGIAVLVAAGVSAAFMWVPGLHTDENPSPKVNVVEQRQKRAQFEGEMQKVAGPCSADQECSLVDATCPVAVLTQKLSEAAPIFASPEGRAACSVQATRAARPGSDKPVASCRNQRCVGVITNARFRQSAERESPVQETQISTH